MKLQKLPRGEKEEGGNSASCAAVGNEGKEVFWDAEDGKTGLGPSIASTACSTQPSDVCESKDIEPDEVEPNAAEQQTRETATEKLEKRDMEPAAEAEAEACEKEDDVPHQRQGHESNPVEKDVVVLSDDDVIEDGEPRAQSQERKEDEKGDADMMGAPMVADGDGASASSEDCLVADLVPPS